LFFPNHTLNAFSANKRNKLNFSEIFLHKKNRPRAEVGLLCFYFFNCILPELQPAPCKVVVVVVSAPTHVVAVLVLKIVIIVCGELNLLNSNFSDVFWEL